MKKLALHLIVLCWTIQYIKGQCPTEWKERQISANERSCYWFSGTLANDKKTFTAAVDECKSKVIAAGLNSNLVKITSAAEQDYIKSEISNANFEYSWIGLTLYSIEWQWIKSGKLLKDQGCYQASVFTSERSISNINTRTNCESGCAGQGFNYAAVSYNGGTTIICQCSNLFIPDYEKLQQNCNQLCPGDNTGTQSCGPTSGVLVSNLAGTAGVWANNQPNNFDNTQGCIALDDANNYKFNDEKCSELRGYMCEYDLASSVCTSSGYIYTSNKCLSIHTGASNQYSWFGARTKCMDRNGDLLSIDSVALQDDLKTRNLNEKLWTGGVGKIWKWNDGTKLDYSHWVDSQPDNNNHKCAVIYRYTGSSADTNWSWEDKDCTTNTYSFVCESNIITTTTTTTTPTTTTTTKPTTTTTKATTTTTTGGQSGSSTTTQSQSGTTTTTSGGQGSTITTTSGGQAGTTTTQSGNTTNSVGTPAARTSDRVLEPGEIVAIIVAGVAVLVGLIRLAVYCCYKNSKD